MTGTNQPVLCYTASITQFLEILLRISDTQVWSHREFQLCHRYCFFQCDYLSKKPIALNPSTEQKLE